VHHNRRYHHLLDPETGAPRATWQRSVSVIAPTCMAADAGATVVFGTPRSRAEAILKTHDARIAHSI
jgi:thiamine biosynthesis lipoprotein